LGKKDKLMDRLKTIPKDFTFEEIRNLLELIGFTMVNKGKTSGSRIKFMNGDISIILHKPHPRKELLEYQVKQILDVLEKENMI
jgi:hypothetical protein